MTPEEKIKAIALSEPGQARAASPAREIEDLLDQVRADERRKTRGDWAGKLRVQHDTMRPYAHMGLPCTFEDCGTKKLIDQLDPASDE